MSSDCATISLPSLGEGFRKETIGLATLYLGDCRDVLPHLSGIDAVVSDPPYGIPSIITNSDIGMRGRSACGTDWGEFKGLSEPFDPAPWLDYPLTILWGANHFAHRLPHNGRWLVWDKRTGLSGATVPQRDQADCELAWVSTYGAARMIRFLWDGLCQDEKKGKRFHPTEKPEYVMDWTLSFAPDAKRVLDPYMGSGTTGVCCVRKGVEFVGVELDERYFETACRRVEAAQKQMALDFAHG